MTNTIDIEAELRCTILPVSGRRVILRAASGAEDLLLLEERDPDLAAGLALVNRLARSMDDAAPGGEADWSHLTASDLDVLILRLRQGMLGDRVRADVACSSAGCGCRIDISFEIDTYIAHHFPRGAAAKHLKLATPISAEPGWFYLSPAKGGRANSAGKTTEQQGREEALERVRFRLPTVGDLLAVANSGDAAEELARRCISPASAPMRQRRRVEAAMEAMAPSLARDLQGVCPECGASVTVHFNARRYCLRELKDRAAFVYQDIDVLARRYHWAEADILAMPRNRRMNYAEMARQEVAP